MKKFLALLLSAALLLGLCACAVPAESETDYSGQTLAGKITALSGSTATLRLGELTESSGQTSSGEAPEMPSGEAPSGEAPEMPSGEAPTGEAPEMPSGEASTGEPPEKPSGEAPTGEPPEMPSGETPSGEAPSGSAPSQTTTTFTPNGETLTVDLSGAAVEKNGESAALSDLAVGTVVRLTFGEKNAVQTVEIVPVSSSSVDQGSAATELTADATIQNASYSSTGDEENALRISGAVVELDGITVDKSAGSSSSPENGDFYGVNAALLATNGAQVTIRSATVTSNAQNGNGVFSYGTGTVVRISDSTITTRADNSGGLQTTGGGTTLAENLTVKTAGSSSAAIRSDRGGGTVSVSGGSYETSGLNSPAVYSTAAITVENASLTATGSEALVIEGKNSITLNNCTVSGHMSEQGSSADENIHTVMIYQSMSGDAAVGSSSFEMTGGSLTGEAGDLIYVTNTAAISLSGATLVQKDSSGALLRVCGNSGSRGWGAAGQNGAQVTLTASNQTLEGDIVVDSISSLDLTLKNGSTFQGTLSGSTIALTVEEGSTLILTGDSTAASLEGSGTIRLNGYTLTLADGTVLR